jgi:hypothetical protein
MSRSYRYSSDKGDFGGERQNKRRGNRRERRLVRQLAEQADGFMQSAAAIGLKAGLSFLGQEHIQTTPATRAMRRS